MYCPLTDRCQTKVVYCPLGWGLVVDLTSQHKIFKETTRIQWLNLLKQQDADM